MKAVKRLKQLGTFCAALLPGSKGQLLLLLGSYFLSLSWATIWGQAALYGRPWQEWPAGAAGAKTLTTGASWYLLSKILSLPVLFAGAAGYFQCLLSRDSSAKKVIRWVVLPALAGIAAEFCGALAMFDISRAGLESSIFRAKDILALIPLLPMGLGPGLRVALAGLVLAVLAAWRMRRATALAAPATAAAEETTREPREFAWAVLALSTPMALLLLAGLLPIETWIGWGIDRGGVPEYWIVEALGGSRRILAAAPMTLIATWMMGREAKSRLKAILAPRRPAILALGAALPNLLHWGLKAAALLGARLHWATYNSAGLVPAPDVAAYLMPGRWQWDLLRFPVWAMAGEIGWRGYGLRAFVDRLGTHRGIVLLGLLWGAMNLDINWVPTRVFGVALAGGIMLSLAWGVAISYPLAWLTLRSGSVLPAAAMTAVIGMLSQMGANEAVPLSGWLGSRFTVLALWAAVAVVIGRILSANAQTESAETSG